MRGLVPKVLCLSEGKSLTKGDGRDCSYTGGRKQVRHLGDVPEECRAHAEHLGFGCFASISLTRWPFLVPTGLGSLCFEQ